MKMFFHCMIGILFFMNTNSQTNIGVQFYSFRNQFKTDVPGTMEKISQMGLKIIEGGGTYGMPMSEYKKLLAKNDLKIVSIGVDFGKLDGDLDSVIAEAKAVGAEYVVCFWIPHNGNDFTIDDVNKAIAVFNKAGKTLQENGLSFCYHPHGYEFRPYNNETLFDHLVKNTNKQYVNYEMDVFWIKHPGQDPLALLKKYPDRFKLMHLKDRKKGTEGNQFGTADEETNVVLGTGDVDIAALIREARKQKIKYLFIEDESSRVMEQVPESLKFIESVK